MGKVLTWVVLIALGWAIWKFIVIGQRKAASRQAERARSDAAATGRQPPASGAARADGEPAAPRQVGQGELMVRCAHCDIYLPKSEAVAGGPLDYCSPAHRVAGPRETGR